MAKKEGKGFFKEFKEFISRGNVLDMAVGIIVGGAFTAIITALVSGVLTPLLQAIGADGKSFGALTIVLKDAVIDPQTNAVIAEAIKIDFGMVISAIVTFLLTAFVLFLIVWTINRVREKLDALKEKRKAAKEAATKAGEEPVTEEAVAEEPAPAPQPTVEELLAQIRDLLAAQNGAGIPASKDEKKE